MPAAAPTGQFVSLNVGDTVVSGQNRWQVVGIFEADGAVAETEVWCDARTLQGAYRRGNTYQSVLAGLETPDVVRHVPRLADVEPAVERVDSPRERVLRRSVAER